MKISVVTPTCDRQIGLDLLEGYMARQTRQPDEWIVANGANAPAILRAGQIELHNPHPPGARNLANNLRAALEAATGDVVIICEDDDYYAPNHIEVMAAALENARVAGCPSLKYFNVAHRCWIEMRNKGSALCQTGFQRQLAPLMISIATQCYRTSTYSIDQQFWQLTQATAALPQTVIGIKGLPGTAGLGVGHRPNDPKRQWISDPTFAKLREWLGDEQARAYTALQFAS